MRHKSFCLVIASLFVTLLFFSACNQPSADSDSSSQDYVADNSGAGSDGGSGDGTGGGGVAGESRGELVSGSVLMSVPKVAINIFLATFGLKTVPSGYSVTIYKIVYKTVDQSGSEVTASGALLVPDVGAPMPMVSVQHGTLSKDDKAPSRMGEFMLEGLWPAANGYISVVPDYIGFGESSFAMHPYVLADATASACLDMIRASKTFLEGKSIVTNGKTFLMGYSEGGYATIALQKDIEQYRSGEISLTAVSAGAGPYDLLTTGVDKVSSVKMVGEAYLAFVVAAYNETLGWGRKYNEIFREPYASMLPGLFDGSKSIGDVNRALPWVTADLLQAKFITDFTGFGESTFKAALSDNSLLGWAPAIPTRLFHGQGDRTVPYYNSTTAINSWRANGAGSVSLVDCVEGDTDHGDCYIPFVYDAIGWFDSF